MSGYYPDGVTGREYAIAGADREYTEERTVACQNEDCADYEVDKDLGVDLESYGSSEWGNFICPVCKTEGSYEGEIEIEEEDPDYAYDRMREERDGW